MNPVRLRAQAGRTVKERKISLGRYRWSSYPGYLSPKHRCTWVTYEILESFGGDTPKGRAAYRRFVEQGLRRKLDDPLEKGRGHGIIGGTSFLEKVTGLLKGGTSARAGQ